MRRQIIAHRIGLRFLRVSREVIEDALGKFRMYVDNDELGTVARDILRGIQRSADLCKLSPPACTGNLGISRSKMPQFRSQYQGAFIQSLIDQGIPVKNTRIAAGRLKATQRELNALTVLEMTVRYKSGMKQDLFSRPVLVSKDDFILDGHHRWATILTLSPGARVPVAKIEMPIRELLKVAEDSPLVQHSDINDT